MRATRTIDSVQLLQHIEHERTKRGRDASHDSFKHKVIRHIHLICWDVLQMKQQVAVSEMAHRESVAER